MDFFISFAFRCSLSHIYVEYKSASSFIVHSKNKWTKNKGKFPFDLLPFLHLSVFCIAKFWNTIYRDMIEPIRWAFVWYCNFTHCTVRTHSYTTQAFMRPHWQCYVSTWSMAWCIYYCIFTWYEYGCFVLPLLYNILILQNVFTVVYCLCVSLVIDTTSLNVFYWNENDRITDTHTQVHINEVGLQNIFITIICIDFHLIVRVHPMYLQVRLLEFISYAGKYQMSSFKCFGFKVTRECFALDHLIKRAVFPRNYLPVK